MTLWACMIITLPTMLWLVFNLMTLQYFKHRSQRLHFMTFWILHQLLQFCSVSPSLLFLNLSFGKFLAWSFCSSISVWSVCVQLFVTSINCSQPGSSLHGIFPARILDWVAFPTPRNLPDPGIQPLSFVSFALAVDSLPLKPEVLFILLTMVLISSVSFFFFLS